MEKQFIYACINGNLELAQSLYLSNNIDISAKNEIKIKLSRVNGVRGGELETERLLYGLDEKAFISACSYGHLEIAKWLLSIKPNIDISALDDDAFIYACKNGHLEVVQWLYSIKPTIDISADYEEAFRSACENGRLEVAKWLLSIKPTIDISIGDDLPFRNSCQNGHIEVAQWLQSLLPDEYELVVIKNDRGDEKISFNIKSNNENNRCPYCKQQCNSEQLKLIYRGLYK